MMTNTEFFAPLIEQLVGTVDDQHAINHSGNTAHQYVEGLREAHPDYLGGDWFIHECIESRIAEFLGYMPEGDDIEQLVEAMNDLAANVND